MWGEARCAAAAKTAAFARCVTRTKFKASPTWNARHGIVAACLILAAGLALWALWSRVTEPRIAPFDAVAHQQMIDDGLKTMTPAEAWQLWIDWYRPMAITRPIEVMEHQHAAAIDAVRGQAAILAEDIASGGRSASSLWRR